MKSNLYKAALAAALGLAGAAVAHAQTLPNADDLVLGFTSQFAGVTSDYLIDLGQLPSAPGVISTSFNSSTFASIFTTSSGNALTAGAVNVGIVGGTTGADAITSLLDTSSLPSATVPGSSAPPPNTKSAIDAAGGLADSLYLGVTPQSSANSFYGDVAENPTTDGSQPNSFALYLNSNPLTTMSGTTENVTLDLWSDSNSGRSGTTGWSYDGYVDLSMNGGNLTASFDEVTPAPEPAAYAIFGVLGVLMLGLRRQLKGKLA